MSKETKVKNQNIMTEAFKLNKEIEVERAICELLERSNNKSGLIKDALGMYACLVNELGYKSPYIQNNVSDWTTILANLNVSGLIGRPAEQVKQEVIQKAVAPAPVFNNPTQGHETITLEVLDEDDENDDNDVEF